MSSDQTPILVGVGELTNRPRTPDEILEPLELMARSAESAAADAQASGILGALDSITVINLISHAYADPAAQLAARLGASPAEKNTTSMGGNSPQWRINETADRIARGELSAALIAGAEAFFSLKLAGKAGAALDWGPKGEPGTVVGDQRSGSNDVERRHQAQLPIRIYPLFENALRAQRGIGIEEHHRLLGALCAGMSAVASRNPNAWFREARTADEIAGDTPDNRMVGFPYRKYMNAIMTVDQGAALLMTSTGVARRLGIPESQWIYVRGCGDAHDLWYVSERADFHSSPAIRLAGERALGQAGITAAELDHVDFYSCFPSALQIGARMLGVADDGSVPLTVTGGLPYHGGPGSNYTTHAVAQLVHRLREAGDASYGLATGVGWYMTKHSVGVYSNTPPEKPWRRHDPVADQASLDRREHPAVVERADGPVTVETYTVLHERDGSPSFGIAVVRTEDGDRAWSNVADPDTLVAMESEEFVGRRGRARHDDGEQVNRLEL